MSLALALVFDLDGTLIDSAPDLQKATNAVLAAEGLAPLDSATTQHLLGDGLRQLLIKAFRHSGRELSEADLARLMPQFTSIYAAITPEKSCIYDGVVDFLTEVKKRGIRLGLCTNKYASATQRLMKQLDLEKFFGVLVSGDTVSACKPHALPLQHALKVLEVESAHAVMIGDHKNDVLTARGAGAKVIGARYGYTKDWPVDAAPDAFIDRFCDLPRVLPGLVKGF